MSESSRDAKWPLAFSVRSEPAGNAGDANVVICEGELDMTTGPQLRDELAAVPDADLIIDLSAVGFIDSTGISILLNSLRRLDRTSRRLVVVCPPGPPRRVFELTGLEETLKIVDSAEDARARLLSSST